MAATSSTLLERAFELARNGGCTNIDDIVRKLKSENYDQVDAHMAGSQIRRQLRQEFQDARRR
ncbi:MAG TPA: hypothetical protein VF649_04500 [Sphingomonas sp.]|uniref:hypothetical protein n=1 Tax=Sphingomonas sp. TaxID=28214 RepID=UPI002EDA5A1C